jgi:hypothetical protein
MERLVSTWFWRRYETEELTERAQAMHRRAGNPEINGVERETATTLADEMTAELARRALEEA